MAPPSNRTLFTQIQPEHLDAFMDQMREASQNGDPDFYGILSAEPKEFNIFETVEAACDVLISLKEDAHTMSSKRR